MVVGKTLPGSEVKLDDVKLEISDQGDFVFGFHREAEEKQLLRVRLPDGNIHTRVLDVKNRQYDIQRIDGLDQQQVTPSPEMALRIKNEANMVRNTRTHMLRVKLFDDQWIWPVEGKITGVFGSQRVLNGEPRSPHYGIDIAVPEGTPVLAPAAGEVILLEDLYYSGVTLMIDHGMGIMSTMLHLKEGKVKLGDMVKKGDVIAFVGNTGRSTGAHLDWRVNWLNNARLDASLLVPPMP